LANHYQIVGDSVQQATSGAGVVTLAVPNDSSGKTAQFVRVAILSAAAGLDGLFATDPGDGAAPLANQMAFLHAADSQIVYTGGSASIYLARSGGTDVTFSVTPVQPQR